MLFVVVGLPHGAVDHITYHHALGRNAKTAPWRFVAPYLAGLGAFAAAFVWAPVLATWAFLVLASWHFGQSHVEVRTSEWLDRLRGFALGALILGTLLDTQSGAASDVMAIWMTESDSAWTLRTIGVGLPMLKLLWTVTAFMAWQRNPEGRTMSTRLLREAAWVVAMWALGPIGRTPLGLHRVLLLGARRRFMAGRIPPPPELDLAVLDLLPLGVAVHVGLLGGPGRCGRCGICRVDWRALGVGRLDRRHRAAHGAA